MTLSYHMVLRISRRHLGVIAASGLASVAGCNSIGDSDISIKVHILNVTDETQDVFFELTKPSDTDFQIGRVLSIENGQSTEIELTVPPGTYRTLLDIDDVVPKPRKTVKWEISDSECRKELHWVIESSEKEITLQAARPSCSSSE